MSSPEQQQESLAQEASVHSLWGELGGLNLAGLDDWEEPQYVDVEVLIEQLVRWTCWYRNITGTPTSHRHTIIAGTPSSFGSKAQLDTAMPQPHVPVLA